MPRLLQPRAVERLPADERQVIERDVVERLERGHG